MSAIQQQGEGGKKKKKKTKLTNLNYAKEEILAKELLSGPVPWHKKQFN